MSTNPELKELLQKANEEGRESGIRGGKEEAYREVLILIERLLRQSGPYDDSRFLKSLRQAVNDRLFLLGHGKARDDVLAQAAGFAGFVQTIGKTFKEANEKIEEERKKTDNE